MNIPNSFIKNVSIARKHIDLSEEDLDNLLREVGLIYSGIETMAKKSVSIELAYHLSKIFNKNIEYFICDHFTPLDLEYVNTKTQNYIKQNKKTNKDPKLVTKFINAYVIIYIRDFAKGTKFTNTDIIPNLPPILNLETSIDWSSGLLKGLVKNTKTYRKSPDDIDPKNRGEVIYVLEDQVPDSIIEKAIKKVDAEWLIQQYEKSDK
ncbi:hypothetical protein ACFX5U_08685 [Sphingobacterium sp. SG20118]|uniref:hypothetical protein n=1 Tax=Sphingobacterium sp. SG20118 TaxID=3367156 RepID=UPI0037DFC489